MLNLNLIVGWAMVLAGLLAGAIIGLLTKDDNWLGGYSTIARRLTRLGHIAFVALGLLNIIVWLLFRVAQNSLLISDSAGDSTGGAVSPGLLLGLVTITDQYRLILCLLFAVGGVLMPIVCFLTSWNSRFQSLFPVPATILIIAAGWFLFLLF